MLAPGVTSQGGRHCHTVRGCTTQQGRSGGRGGHSGSAGEEQVSPVTPAPSQWWYRLHHHSGIASIVRASETCTTTRTPIIVSPVIPAPPQRWYRLYCSNTKWYCPYHSIASDPFTTTRVVSPPLQYHNSGITPIIAMPQEYR